MNRPRISVRLFVLLLSLLFIVKADCQEPWEQESMEKYRQLLDSLLTNRAYDVYMTEAIRFDNTFKNSEHLKFRLEASNALLTAYYYNGRTEEALRLVDSVLDLSMELKDTFEIFLSYTRKGSFYYHIPDVKIAEESFKAAETYITNGYTSISKRSQISLYHNMSLLYIELMSPKAKASLAKQFELVQGGESEVLLDYYSNLMIYHLYISEDSLGAVTAYDSLKSYVDLASPSQYKTFLMNEIDLYMFLNLKDSVSSAILRHLSFMEEQVANARENNMSKTKGFIKRESELVSTNNVVRKAYREQLTTSLLVGTIAVISFIAILLYVNNKRKSAELEKAKSEQRRLQSQMNPHFVFNALSAVQTLVNLDKKEEAKNYLSRLSRLIRNILELSRQENISLAEELLMIENYMQLQKLHFKNKFTYSIHVDADVDTQKVIIPSMIIQPFAENAIKHAYAGIQEGGSILFKVSLEKNNLLVTIEDFGIGIGKNNIPSEQLNKKSLSISITKERLQSLSTQIGQNATLTIVDKTGKGESGTLVTICIPQVNYKSKLTLQ